MPWRSFTASISSEMNRTGLEAVEEHAAPHQESRRQHRGAHGALGPGELNGLVYGSGRAAHRDLRVPQPVLHPLGDGGDVGCELVSVQEEQIDIRVDAHLAARVAPHRHHAQFARLSSLAAEIMLLGQVEESAHEAIDQIGMGLVDGATAGAGCVQRAQILPRLFQIRAHG